MTDAELQAIEESLKGLDYYDTVGTLLDDVPQLIAEVRRLRAQLEEFGACDGCGTLYNSGDGHVPACPKSKR